MKPSKAPPWKFSVWQKEKELCAFVVPAHKLGPHVVGRFLHALVVRIRTKSLEEMIPYYVNGRRGNPSRIPFANVIRYQDDDLTENGFWCGEWECYALATQTMTEEWAAAVRQIRGQSKRSA